MHALIIEDRGPIAALLVDELGRLGYHSLAVATGEGEAVAAAETHRPDLLVVDDRIRDGSGIRAASRICCKALTPVVFLIGNPEHFADAVPHAVLIEQPFGSRSLLKAIRSTRERAWTASHELGVA